MFKTAEIASGGRIVLSGAVINKEWENIFRLSTVTFNKIRENLRLFSDKKTSRTCNQLRYFFLCKRPTNPNPFLAWIRRRLLLHYPNQGRSEGGYWRVLHPHNFLKLWYSENNLSIRKAMATQNQHYWNEVNHGISIILTNCIEVHKHKDNKSLYMRVFFTFMIPLPITDILLFWFLIWILNRFSRCFSFPLDLNRKD